MWRDSEFPSSRWEIQSSYKGDMSFNWLYLRSSLRRHISLQNISCVFEQSCHRAHGFTFRAQTHRTLLFLMISWFRRLGRTLTWVILPLCLCGVAITWWQELVKWGILAEHLSYGLVLAFHTYEGSSELVICSWLLMAVVERDQLVGRILPFISQPCKSCSVTLSQSNGVSHRLPRFQGRKLTPAPDKGVNTVE